MKLFFFITLSFLLLNPLHAATKNRKGQVSYLKHCSKCHGNGHRGGGLSSQQGWRDYFKANAKELKHMHEEKPEVLSYLNSKGFKKREKYIKAFLIEFANDSSNAATCN